MGLTSLLSVSVCTLSFEKVGFFMIVLLGVGLLEIGLLGVGLLEIGLLGVGLLEIGLLEIGLLEIGLLEIGLLGFVSPELVNGIEIRLAAILKLCANVKPRLLDKFASTLASTSAEGSVLAMEPAWGSAWEVSGVVTPGLRRFPLRLGQAMRWWAGDGGNWSVVGGLLGCV
jgi:hypothetical protein